MPPAARRRHVSARPSVANKFAIVQYTGEHRRLVTYRDSRAEAQRRVDELNRIAPEGTQYAVELPKKR